MTLNPINILSSDRGVIPLNRPKANRRLILLVKRWSNLSRKANIEEFEHFFQEYYIPVLHYCGTILKDMDDAKDIVQQAFVSLWQKREETNFHTSSRAYLYKTTYNASLDFLKHKKIKLKHAQETLNTNSVAEFSDPAAERELETKIHHAIGELPEQCKKIFVMSRFENLKYREIADRLNIAEKTVENQMGKALKLLRELLKNYLSLLVIAIQNVL